MIAQGMLLLWPLVALALYVMLPVGRATIWTLLAGYLLLPIQTAFDFPGVPALDKSSIPNLMAAILAPIMAKRGEFRWPRSKFVNLLMLIFVLAPFGTAYTNGDPITIGRLTMPGMGFREGLSFSVGKVLELAPFLLGAALLGTERAHRQVLLAFVLAGLAYSVPILFEIRFSPILQTRLYGVSVDFLQQIRGGGFRSVVFLGHGLFVSTFIAMALMAAIGLSRMRERLFTLPMAGIACFLAVILVLNKSLGSMIFTVALAAPFLFLRKKQFLTFALVVSLMIVTYPALRTSGLLPLKQITETIGMVSKGRASSLNFRLKNEEMLLSRAERRPMFGWGSYGRNRVIVVTSWGATSDVSVTDGTWVITIGIWGWIGYLASFGLLTYPFWRIFKFRNVGVATGTVSLLAMHLLNMLDLIPNSSLRPISWLVAGALAGLVIARRPVARTPAIVADRRLLRDVQPEPILQH